MSLTKEQLALRRTVVGSSEIGALVDFYSPRPDGRVDPYKTALAVFADKDLPLEDDAAEHQTWGLDIEPAILRNHARRHGLHLVKEAPGTLVHGSLPLCATPDGIGITAEGRARDIQAKNAQRFSSHRWGEAGTDDVPLLYVAQVTVELGILRQHRDWQGRIEDTGDLAVCLEGAPPTAYFIDFDPELFGALADLAAKFKRDHLDKRKAPLIDGSDTAADYVRRRWAKHTGEMLPWTPDAQALYDIARTHAETEKIAASLKEGARNQLKALIGEAAGIESIATWKRCKDSTAIATDWQAAALEVAVLAMKGSEEDGKSFLAPIAKKHTRKVVTREGVRKMHLMKPTGQVETEEQ